MDQTSKPSIHEPSRKTHDIASPTCETLFFFAACPCLLSPHVLFLARSPSVTRNDSCSSLSPQPCSPASSSFLTDKCPSRFSTVCHPVVTVWFTSVTHSGHDLSSSSLPYHFLFLCFSTIFQHFCNLFPSLPGNCSSHFCNLLSSWCSFSSLAFSVAVISTGVSCSVTGIQHHWPAFPALRGSSPLISSLYSSLPSGCFSLLQQVVFSIAVSCNQFRHTLRACLSSNLPSRLEPNCPPVSAFSRSGFEVILRFFTFSRVLTAPPVLPALMFFFVFLHPKLHHTDSLPIVSALVEDSLRRVATLQALPPRPEVPLVRERLDVGYFRNHLPRAQDLPHVVVSCLLRRMPSTTSWCSIFGTGCGSSRCATSAAVSEAASDCPRTAAHMASAAAPLVARTFTHGLPPRRDGALVIFIGGRCPTPCMKPGTPFCSKQSKV